MVAGVMRCPYCLSTWPDADTFRAHRCREERAWNETLDRVKGENEGGAGEVSGRLSSATRHLMPYPHRPSADRLSPHFVACRNASSASGRVGWGLSLSGGREAHD